MAKDVDSAFIFVLGLFMGSVIITLVVVLFMWGKESVDVNAFGTKLCESQHLVYDRYQWTEDKSVPKIICKENKEQSIYDGVVVVEDN